MWVNLKDLCNKSVRSRVWECTDWRLEGTDFQRVVESWSGNGSYTPAWVNWRELKGQWQLISRRLNALAVDSEVRGPTTDVQRRCLSCTTGTLWAGRRQRLYRSNVGTIDSEERVSTAGAVGSCLWALQPEAEGQAQQAWEFQAAARQLEQVLRCLLEEWLWIDCPRAGARTVIDGPRDGDRLAALMAASGPSFASSAYCRHCQGSDRAVGAKQKGKLLKCRVATANAVQEWGRLCPSLQR